MSWFMTRDEVAYQEKFDSDKVLIFAGANAAKSSS